MNSHVRRVLMTTDAVGGVWHYALELAAGLGRAGADVTLAVMGPQPDGDTLRRARAVPGLHVRHRNLKLEWMEDPWHDLDAASDWLLELAREAEPDLVHLNNFAHAPLPWPAPVLVVGHSCVASWFRAVRRVEPPAEWLPYCRMVASGLEAADCVVAPTRAMLDELRLYGARMQRACVIPNARNPAAYQALSKRDFILTAGRLWDPAKNVDLLDRLAPRLSHAVFAAGPAAAPGGRPTAFRHVWQLGCLSPLVLSQWMGMASVYAGPARYEPFGLTALEAANCGCALVLGDIPSLREVWGPAARYADPDDDDEWVYVLNALMDEPAQRRRYAERARRRARDYTPDRMISAYMELYAALRPRARAQPAA